MPPSGASHNRAASDSADQSAPLSQDPPRRFRPACGTLMSETMPATGIAGMLAAPSSCARPSRAVPPGSVAELSCQKIIFDLQLADLPVQKIDLRFIGGSLRRHAALEDAHRTIQQLLLPVVDLVRVDPEMHRQLGDGPVALDCRQRHLRLERRTVLLPCPLHIPAPALSALSRGRAPP